MDQNNLILVEPHFRSDSHDFNRDKKKIHIIEKI